MGCLFFWLSCRFLCYFHLHLLPIVCLLYGHLLPLFSCTSPNILFVVFESIQVWTRLNTSARLEDGENLNVPTPYLNTWATAPSTFWPPYLLTCLSWTPILSPMKISSLFSLHLESLIMKLGFPIHGNTFWKGDVCITYLTSTSMLPSPPSLPNRKFLLTWKRDSYASKPWHLNLFYPSIHPARTFQSLLSPCVMKTFANPVRSTSLHQNFPTKKCSNCIRLGEPTWSTWSTHTIDGCFNEGPLGGPPHWVFKANGFKFEKANGHLWFK